LILLAKSLKVGSQYRFLERVSIDASQTLPFDPPQFILKERLQLGSGFPLVAYSFSQVVKEREFGEELILPDKNFYQFLLLDLLTSM